MADQMRRWFDRWRAAPHNGYYNMRESMRTWLPYPVREQTGEPIFIHTALRWEQGRFVGRDGRRGDALLDAYEVRAYALVERGHGARVRTDYDLLPAIFARAMQWVCYFAERGVANADAPLFMWTAQAAYRAMLHQRKTIDEYNEERACAEETKRAHELRARDIERDSIRISADEIPLLQLEYMRLFALAEERKIEFDVVCVEEFRRDEMSNRERGVEADMIHAGLVAKVKRTTLQRPNMAYLVMSDGTALASAFPQVKIFRGKYNRVFLPLFDAETDTTPVGGRLGFAYDCKRAREAQVFNTRVLETLDVQLRSTFVTKVAPGLPADIRGLVGSFLGTTDAKLPTRKTVLQ